MPFPIPRTEKASVLVLALGVLESRLTRIKENLPKRASRLDYWTTATGRETSMQLSEISKQRSRLFRKLNQESQRQFFKNLVPHLQK